MFPKELRAFREALGMTRREFAPKLFISEPTLERWERGHGGPREIHLQVLRRMREYLRAGHSATYFQYDAGADKSVVDLLNDEKQQILEALKTMAIVLLDEKNSRDGNEWLLRFGLGWAIDEPIDLVLLCEGSDRPERPIIDFALEITADRNRAAGCLDAFREPCLSHGIALGLVRRGKDRSTLTLRYRMFTTGCNADTIKHVLGNYQSCWNKIKDVIVAPPLDESRGQRSRDTTMHVAAQ